MTEQLTGARDGKKAIISPSGEGGQKGDHSLTAITELKKVLAVLAKQHRGSERKKIWKKVLATTYEDFSSAQYGVQADGKHHPRGREGGSREGYFFNAYKASLNSAVAQLGSNKKWVLDKA